MNNETSKKNQLSWQQQLRFGVRNESGLSKIFELTDAEKAGMQWLRKQKTALPLLITPHFISLMDTKASNDPLRMQMIPRIEEGNTASFLRSDPLGEEDHEEVPHLIHRYPDRALLFVSDRCASYCRFCTRKRFVGQGPTPKNEDLERALEYIEQNSHIWEVILSGGDSLILSNAKLEYVLARLRAISSVKIIRLHTRMLSFAPSRFDDDLLDILAKFQPLYVVVHVNHPNEMSEAAKDACKRIVEKGIVLLNQSVLLKGINDNANVLESLFRTFVENRIRPYYLHQCDIAHGTEHFRVPIKEAIKLVGSLRGKLSGLAQPTFVIDIPGGYGKVPIFENPVVREDEDFIYLRGFEGEVAAYPK